MFIAYLWTFTIYYTEIKIETGELRNMPITYMGNFVEKYSPIGTFFYHAVFRIFPVNKSN